MKDLLILLKKAKEKKIFTSQQEFRDVLAKIEENNNLRLDWDEEAGEDWARFIHEEMGVVCMMSVKVGIAFVRRNYSLQDFQEILEDVNIVLVDNYSSNEWYIDLVVLDKELPQICWHACENAVDANCFSLDDLYFATI